MPPRILLRDPKKPAVIIGEFPSIKDAMYYLYGQGCPPAWMEFAIWNGTAWVWQSFAEIYVQS